MSTIHTIEDSPAIANDLVQRLRDEELISVRNTTGLQELSSITNTYTLRYPYLQYTAGMTVDHLSLIYLG